MTLRARLALVCATTYFVMRHELRSQLDNSLKNAVAATQVAVQADPSAYTGVQDFGGNLVEVIDREGNVQAASYRVKPDAPVLAVAAGTRDGFFRDITAPDPLGEELHLRELVAPEPGFFGATGAVIAYKNLQETNRALERLRFILILVSLGGIAAAGVAGALVSGAALAPVRRLTAAAERIAETGEPSERVPEGGQDELGRLGASFNTMLASLEESLETQRRFVADASHELRTPLTSMQTNIEVLKQHERLGAEQRQRLFDDLEREAHEMRDLIGGLLELARSEDARLERTDVQLDELVEAAVVRARARFPKLAFLVRLEPTRVEGSPDRLERAVWNLLENAGKWSSDGGSVEVSLVGGELQVRDHGPGFADEDRPLVFDRFYRSAAARSMPGAGLGLAIVREVAEAHGGTVVAENARDGGAVVRLSLNGAARPGSAGHA